MANIVGYYPWFATYNTLEGYLPKKDAQGNDFTGVQKLGRRALMGFGASAVSDVCSNSIRVRCFALVGTFSNRHVAAALSSAHPFSSSAEAMVALHHCSFAVFAYRCFALVGIFSDILINDVVIPVQSFSHNRRLSNQLQAPNRTEEERIRPLHFPVVRIICCFDVVFSMYISFL